jgi:translation initiation factor 1A
MVKNTTGGSKTKGQARKFANAVVPKNILRLSQDELEVYAQVTKILGNGMCHVICADNVQRLCHIRGKFRGRGKRDNMISMGTWILVGLREWEIGKTIKDKLENCDLLEVYSDLDKDRLKNAVNSVNWSVFIANDNKYMNNDKDSSDYVQFTDDRTAEYEELITSQIGDSATKFIAIDEEEINIDDI